jgi:heme exporter protein B
MNGWRLAFELARHDLLVERRAKEAWTLLVPFGLAALLTIPLAIGADLPLIARIGPAVFWSVMMLFGMQVAWRPSAVDTGALRDLQLLLGIPPVVRFAGRAMANAVLLALYLVVLGGATLVFYSPPPPPRWPLLFLIGLLFTSGLSLTATLAGDIASGLRTRTSLAPLLVAPLALPLVVTSSQAVEALARDRGILSWLMMLVAANLVIGGVASLSARPLEESAR